MWVMSYPCGYDKDKRSLTKYHPTQDTSESNRESIENGDHWCPQEPHDSQAQEVPGTVQRFSLYFLVGEAKDPVHSGAGSELRRFGYFRVCALSVTLH
jgi:hypothetical protein